MNRYDLLATVVAALSAGLVPKTTRSQSTPRGVLWVATVRTTPLAERLEAARSGRFDAMSVFPIDDKAWRSGGMSGADIRGMIEDSGVDAAILDPLVQWVARVTGGLA